MLVRFFSITFSIFTKPFLFLIVGFLFFTAESMTMIINFHPDPLRKIMRKPTGDYGTKGMQNLWSAAGI